MKLSKKGEYALRAMIDLACNYKKEFIQVKEISQKEKIPKKFLDQILLELKNHGLLESRSGKGGGYRLAKEPSNITFAEIIRIIDGPLAPLHCVSKMAHIHCTEEKNCGLRTVMQQVRNSIAKILEGVTLSDMCPDKDSQALLKRLKGLSYL
mgnify:FL=1